MYKPLRDKDSSGTLVSLKHYRAWPPQDIHYQFEGCWGYLGKHLAHFEWAGCFFNILQIFINWVHSNWATEVDITL